EEDNNYVNAPAWTEDEVAAPPVISANNAQLTAENQQLETLMQHLNLSKDNSRMRTREGQQQSDSPVGQPDTKLYCLRKQDHKPD
ncbi:hypothetical protein FQN60_017329, partial [Etheostoma spectabile]